MIPATLSMGCPLRLLASSGISSAALPHGVKPGLGHSLVPDQPLIPTIKLQALDFIRCFRETRPKSTLSTGSGAVRSPAHSSMHSQATLAWLGV